MHFLVKSFLKTRVQLIGSRSLHQISSWKLVYFIVEQNDDIICIDLHTDAKNFILIVCIVLTANTKTHSQKNKEVYILI